MKPSLLWLCLGLMGLSVTFAQTGRATMDAGSTDTLQVEAWGKNLDAEKLLEETLEYSDFYELDSYAYQGEVVTYFSDEGDTVRHSVEAIMLPNKWDLALQGKFWLKVGEKEYFYEKDSVETWKPGEDTIRLVETSVVLGMRDLGMTARLAMDVPLRVANHIEGSLRRAKGETYHKTVELYQGRPFWVIEVVYESMEDVYHSRDRFWVDPETQLITQLEQMSDYPGGNSYTALRIHREAFNRRSEVQMLARRALWPDLPRAPYAWARPEPEAEEDEAEEEAEPVEVAKGLLAPDFTGALFQQGDSLSLADAQSKVVVLDFFFARCVPCMLTAPTLDSLYEEFHAQGLTVWGVNSIDADSSEWDYLANMLADVGSSYPVLLVDKKVDESYGVTGYPQIFVLNEQREVVHVLNGYSKGQLRKLRRAVEKELEE